MSGAVVSFDTSRVHDGKLEEVRAAIMELTRFVAENEPRMILYNVYLNADGTEMTVVQIHPDSASMELHMELAAPVFGNFKGLITLTDVRLYGKPSQHLIQQMQRKASVLGPATLQVLGLEAGLERL